ncbi:glycosyltransferase [Aequorivita echinoideorum]|uniref:Glycosyltransferase n=1 Tax=Aequorivita echinoideorum TaxID=1549647 RepID=A0ABS5S7Z6_9FLAO|nr:glycosyltransferase [Aequorivita echinoideorum]MBT0608487.1 glycosyltransferase [Aequorivita echinoideorum]
MTILHINGSGSWGGNEQQLADLIPELEKLGVKSMVMGRPNAPLYEYCKKNNIPFIEAKKGKLSKKPNYPYLKEIVKLVKPTVLHLHSSDSVTLFTIADILYRLKTPTVFSKKGMGSNMSFLSIFKYNYKNINRIICVSKAVKFFMERDVMKEKNKKKLVVIYDGINTERLKPLRQEKIKTLFKIKEEKVVIGNIANHTAAKDLPTLLKAMHHLIYKLNMPNVHLVQIGEFSGLTAELKELQEKLKLTDHVTFTDFQKNATDFLPQFEIYVMSSEREGLPLTIYEAFYKKVPVVSTKAGGIPEVISHGENGYLAEVGDYVKLAEEIKALLGNQDLKNEFSDKSYELFMKEYNANITAQKMLELYTEVAKK